MADYENPNHKKKMVAPIVVSVILILYYAIYFGVLIALVPSMILKLLFAIIPILFGGVIIAVCMERINEIRSGEEDDLSKY